MSHTPHELAAEFPADAARISQLRTDNAHFARLAEEHHAVNRSIHRIETQAEAASDERLETLKRERLSLLDQLAAMVRAARSG